MQQDKLMVYAAYYDNEIRLSSSSGGVFSVLSEHMLHLGGVIYGVAMSDDCRVAEYIRVSSREEFYKLQGSKYLQAKMSDTLKNVKRDLEDGLIVLFSGTGCQINGLKSFLQKEYKNLYCVDVVCHGVPSPAVWRKYVEEREFEYGCRLDKTLFRSKDVNWVDFGMKLYTKNGNNVFIPMKEDKFMTLFLSNYSLRPSCYQCSAKNTKLADITIADFWGIDSVAPEMNDNKGVSLVLIRTRKGKELFDRIKDIIKYRQVSYDEGVRGNPAEYKSVDKPFDRDDFFRDFISEKYTNKGGLDKLVKKYCSNKIIHVLKKRVKRMIQAFLNLLS